MAKPKSTVALEADPFDPEDGAVTRAAVEQALAERRERRTRGPQRLPTKQQVTLRLDREVLDRFRAGGAGWQSRINEVLRKAGGL